MILTASFQLVLVPKCCLARIICPSWCFPPGIVTNTRSIPFQFSSVVKGCYALKFPLSCSHNQPFYIHKTWGFTAGQLMGLSYFYSSTITTSWLREILKWIKQNSNNKKPFADLSLVLLYLYHKLWGYVHTCLLSPSFSQNLHCLTSSELDGSMGSPVRVRMLLLANNYESHLLGVDILNCFVLAGLPKFAPPRNSAGTPSS